MDQTWMQVIEEAENEVFTLCVGFLCAVCARASITGTMPMVLLHHMGGGEAEEEAPYSSCLALCGVSVLSAGICIVLVACCGGHKRHHRLESEQFTARFWGRLFYLVIKTFGLTFA